MQPNDLSRAFTDTMDDDDVLVAQGIDLDFDVDDKLNFYVVFTCPTCGKLTKPYIGEFKDGQGFACEECSDFTLTVQGEEFTKVLEALNDMRRTFGLPPLS